MLVIGNGESRSGININSIDQVKVGCNAVYRDYKVDHLICVDRKMVREVVNSDVTNIVYTRKDWYNEFSSNPLVQEVPELPYYGTERQDEPFQWGSGPYAVLLASMLADPWDEDINLIGFDLYSATDRVNNVYKDTQNYNKSEHHSIDPRYWIHQIGKVFENFPHHNYKIYQSHLWQVPKAWNQPNVSLDKISNL
jgi:hypothetical protein